MNIKDQNISKTEDILIIIPAYNEEQRLDKVLIGLPDECLGAQVDTLVVNDGSTDKTRQIAERRGCLILDHPNRQGYGASLIGGFNYALKKNYGYITKLDGDGQHEPAYIKTIIKILKRGGTDYVLSSRYQRKIDCKSTAPAERKLVNRMITGAINSVTRQNLTDVFCGCFGLTVETLKKLNLKTTNYGIELEMILQAHFAGAQILEIPHPLIYTEGSSKFLEVYGESHNLGARLEAYTTIMMDALKQLGISEF
ncbi:glycosyltransferase family 2 protein [Patescibacteria group bacterium]|nr:glycosyltransferase family 2 protein [Patescibacteria group bacterium]